MWKAYQKHCVICGYGLRQLFEGDRPFKSYAIVSYKYRDDDQPYES